MVNVLICLECISTEKRIWLCHYVSIVTFKNEICRYWIRHCGPHMSFLRLYLYLYVTWQYALLCYYAAGAFAPHCVFYAVLPDKNCAYVHWGSLTFNSSSVRRAIWFTWFFEPHDTISLQACPSVYNTWWYQAVTHPIMDRARRCLTLVIEPTPMS